MTAIATLVNPIFGSIRIVTDAQNEPKFCLTDVCDSLELLPKKVAQRLNDEVLSKYPITDRFGRTQVALFVNEDGLYDTILDSRKPEAKQFRRWITSEVLPSVRKTGGYMVSSQSDSNEDIMARALLIANDTIERIKNKSQQLETKTIELEAKIEADQPRVLFSKAVETSEKSILVGELARILKQNGIEIGQNRMFEHLRENHYLISRRGEMYNQPTQKGLELGLFELKKTTITKPDGTVLVSNTTKITCKGQMYFVNKFLNSKSL